MSRWRQNPSRILQEVTLAEMAEAINGRMPHEIGVPKHSIRMTPKDDVGCNVWVPDARCLGMWR